MSLQSGLFSPVIKNNNEADVAWVREALAMHAIAPDATLPLRCALSIESLQDDDRPDEYRQDNKNNNEDSGNFDWSTVRDPGRRKDKDDHKHESKRKRRW